MQLSQALKPYPYFQNVYEYYPHIGRFMGRGAQAILRRQIAKGLQLQTGYTFSKLLSDPLTVPLALPGNISTGIQNSYAPHSEYSVDPSDVTHRFTGNLSYQLPFGQGQTFLNHASSRVNDVVSGWNLAGTVIGESGRPLAISGASSLVATRPDFVVGQSLHVPHPNRSQWFNQLAFKNPTDIDINGKVVTYRFGDVPRTLSQLRSPGDLNLNVSLSKQTTLSESYKLELRVEAFNVINRVNYNAPNTSFVAGALSSGSSATTAPTYDPTKPQTYDPTTAFGSLTGATQARTLQLTAKFLF
jgi:hypothetical protein